MCPLPHTQDRIDGDEMMIIYDIQGIGNSMFWGIENILMTEICYAGKNEFKLNTPNFSKEGYRRFGVTFDKE